MSRRCWIIVYCTSCGRHTLRNIPINITMLAQYYCSIFIFLFILYCIQYKILYTEGYRKEVFPVRVCVKMLQKYWASTVIFIGIFSQCRRFQMSACEVCCTGSFAAITRVKSPMLSEGAHDIVCWDQLWLFWILIFCLLHLKIDCHFLVFWLSTILILFCYI